MYNVSPSKLICKTSIQVTQNPLLNKQFNFTTKIQDLILAQNAGNFKSGLIQNIKKTP